MQNQCRFIACMCVALLSACTSVQLDKGGERHRYFGFVEVHLPNTEAQHLKAYKITSMGLAIGNGVTLGVKDEEQVLVPLKLPETEGAPYEATCSLTVIVRSVEEAEQAASILRPLEGENICLVSFE